MKHVRRNVRSKEPNVSQRSGKIPSKQFTDNKILSYSKPTKYRS